MHVGIASGFANHRNVDDRQFIREEMTQLLLAIPTCMGEFLLGTSPVYAGGHVWQPDGLSLDRPAARAQSLAG